MDYDFDQTIDRRGTGSLKWERYRGRDCLPLWVADMDFRSPPEVIEALRTRVDHGVFGYAVPTRALVQAVVDRMERMYGWAVQPDWIVWIPGVVSGLHIACRAIGSPGDGVATFTPIYPPFLAAPGHTDRTLLRVPLARHADRIAMDVDRFQSSITDRTRLLLLCSPHNPVGRSFGREELEQVAEVCLRHRIVICSDEIHCDLILDERQHVCTATLSPEVEQQTITLMAPSKTFNIPGLGCALAIIPNGHLRRQFADAKAGLVPHVNVFGFEAALAAYQYGEPWRRALLKYLAANRDCLVREVNRIPGLSMGPVEATYLAWIDARGLGVDDPARFFEQAGVGLSDGTDFDGPGFVRLNFGCPRVTLEQALARMAGAVRP
ncbi:MAG: PatB family C-S lyase [Phycisphaerae bacterium]|nr:PatB family C-S lyase [Phycisphaerae bacterium]